MHTETVLCEACNSYHIDHSPELRAEVERLQAALLVYAEDYEGCELARKVLGLPPLDRTKCR
jgi:hypothetical protein